MATTKTPKVSKSCEVCDQPNGKSCANCKQAYYCTVEHQRSHWKTHKKDCVPFMEQDSREMGRYLVSARKIEQGELMSKETPLISAPYSAAPHEELWALCLGCCKLLNKNFGQCEQRCEKCSWPLCSATCRKVKYHTDFECKIFQDANLQPQKAMDTINEFGIVLTANAIYECVKIIRCLVLKEKEPAKWDKLLSLESHAVYRQSIPKEFYLSTFFVMFIRNYCKLSKYTEKLIDFVYGIVSINSIGGGDVETLDPAYGLTSRINERASKLIHSCVPNSQIISRDITEIKATVAIESGQVLTECYEFDRLLYQDIVQRRLHLHYQYLFWCKCPRCADPTELGTFASAIKCFKKQCAGVLLPVDSLNVKSRWKCRVCGDHKEYGWMNDKIMVKVHNAISKAASMDENLKILKKNSNITLHENHGTLMKLRYDLLKPFSEAIELARGTPRFAQLNETFGQLAIKCVEQSDKLGMGLILHNGMLLYFKTLALHNSLSEHGFAEMAQRVPLQNEILVASLKCQEEAIKIFEGIGVPIGTEANLAYKWLVLRRATLASMQMILQDQAGAT